MRERMRGKIEREKTRRERKWIVRGEQGEKEREKERKA